jgi:phage nucleotide-binding protein
MMNPKTLEALNASIIDPTKSSPHFRIICYGDVGVGKTTWATTDAGSVLLIDSSEGYVTIKDTSNITVMEYQGLSQIEAVAEALKEGLWTYDTVVLDELSTIAKLDLQTVVDAQSKKGNIREDAVPEQRDYLASQNRVAKAVNALFSAPVNVILLAHERKVTDKTSGKTTIESDFAPGLKVEINRTLHVIGRLEVSEKGDARAIRVNPTKTVQAKNRLGLNDGVTLRQILEG